MNMTKRVGGISDPELLLTILEVVGGYRVSKLLPLGVHFRPNDLLVARAVVEVQGSR